MKSAVRMIMVLATLTTTVVSFSQGKRVTGTVTSELGGSATSGATVRVRGSLVAARTDSRVAYGVTVPDGAIQVLIFGHEDFGEMEIAIDGGTVGNVVLFSNIRFNQYGVPADRKPIDSGAREGILVFGSKDRGYMVYFDSRVQIDGSFLWGAKYNTTPSFGTEVRRARFAMKVELPGNWEAELDMDFADSRANLKDLFLKYALDNNKWMRAGTFKEVFSVETNTTPYYLTFTERPIGTWVLTPSRHLGVQASYGLRPFLAIEGIHFQDVGGWVEIEIRKTAYQFVADNVKLGNLELAGYYKSIRLQGE